MSFSPAIIFSTIAFMFGSCIGSFLNVCIYRIPLKKSIISPGSYCPTCKNAIPFYLNIPVAAYILLKGRCRHCKTKIPARYPLVEFLTGAMAVLIYLKFGFTPTAFFWFVFTSTLITISFIDFDHQIIPDIISLPGILVFAASFYFVPEMTAKQTILGILVGGGSLYSVAVIYSIVRKEEGMGGGDIKLLAMIGAAVGVKGVLFTIFAGSLFGTLIGVTLMICARTSDLKFKIPFGPYLSLGAICYVFYGQPIIDWYFSLIALPK